MSENGALVLHRGARQVALDELAEVKAPPPEGRWFPLSHHTVLRRVKETLAESGYEVKRERLALSRGDARFFGILNLATTLVDGVSLAVGIRNSTDKSFPLGFCAGNSVFVCDNLAFRADLLVRRKHTRNGEQRFASDIAGAVTKLKGFAEQETKRIAIMRSEPIGYDRADALILRAFEKGIIPATMLGQIIREWREPKHEEFKSPTYWSLFNAFTSALAPKATRDPQGYALTTVRLNSLVFPETTNDPQVQETHDHHTAA